MPTLIDGHNLIPALGMDLSSHDDELALIEKLNEYCRLSRSSHVEVFFDNAQPGSPEKQKFGLLTVCFVRRPRIADEAIRQRLVKLQNDAKNWSVVSSDRRVQAEARNMGAKIIPSEQFASSMMDTLIRGQRKGPVTEQKMISEKEVDEWLEVFKKGKNNKYKD